MNKELLKLAHISNKGISKKFIFIIVITIIFILAYVPFSIYKTYDEIFNYLMNTNYDVKKIQIIREDQKDEVLKLNLQDNEHVVAIFEDTNSYSAVVYWLEQNQDYSLRVIQSIEGFVPDVIKGHGINSENEIICPNRLAFGGYDDKNVDDLLNMEEYLNKEIVLKNYKRVSEDETLEFDYKVKIVGLFDSALIYDYNGCYGSKELVEKMHENFKPYDYDKEFYRGMVIFSDDYRNVPEITAILDQNNIEYFVPSFDMDFMSTIINASLIVSIIFFIISTFTLYIYIVNYIKAKRKNIALYRAMGYSYSTIQFIIYYGISELLLISYAISSVIAIIAKYVIQHFARQIVSFSLLDIKLSYLIMGLFIILSLCLTYIVSRRIVKKNIKNEIKDIMV